MRSASANVDLRSHRGSGGGAGRDRHAVGQCDAGRIVGIGLRELLSRYLGLTWTPVSPVQITASLNVTQTAPDIAQLTQPVVTITNVAFFDFATGTNALVTLTSGGNADLAPERRRVSTVGATWKPMKARELRLALNYIETRIDDQTVNIVRGSPALLAAFPERFRRDADGQLLTADLRPINVASNGSASWRGGSTCGRRWALRPSHLPRRPAAPPRRRRRHASGRRCTASSPRRCGWTIR